MEDVDFLPATQMLDSTQRLGDDENENVSDVVIGQLEVGEDVYQILRGETKIGRDPICAVYINNPNLSRVHAVIEADQEGVTINDNKSSNGTRKGAMVLKPHVRYDLQHGDTLKFGAITAVFKHKNNDDDDSDNNSDSLLDDENENVPPNFVPETPAAVTRVTKGRPSLSDLSFVPESQSSPLPTSANIVKNHCPFKIPESPMSDLNESSFIGASQQVTVGSRAGGLTRRQLTTITNNDSKDESTAVPDSDMEDSNVEAIEDTIDETKDDTDILNADTEKIDQSGGMVKRVDTKGLDGLFSSVRSSKLINAETQDVSKTINQSTSNLLVAETQAVGNSMLVAETQAVGNSMLVAETQAVGYSMLVAETQAVGNSMLVAETQAVGNSMLVAETQAVGNSMLVAETQAVGNSMLVAETQAVNNSVSLADSSYFTVKPQTKDKIQGKMSDSEIIAASTQILMAKLNESESMAMTPKDSSTPNITDSLILVAAAAQDNLEDTMPDEEDELLLAATQPTFKTPCLPSTSSMLEADTALMCNDMLSADTVPVLVDGVKEADEDQDVTAGEVAAEDQTQCEMSFEDIRDNLEAAEEVFKNLEPVQRSSLSSIFPLDNNKDDDQMSNCSDDLLAAVDDEKVDDSAPIDHMSKTSVDNISMEEATQPPPTMDTIDNDNNADEELSKTSVENISMVAATQPPPVVVDSAQPDPPMDNNVTQPGDKSMVEASQPAPCVQRSGTMGRNNTDVNSISMDQTIPVNSDIIAATPSVSDQADNGGQSSTSSPRNSRPVTPVDSSRPTTPTPSVTDISRPSSPTANDTTAEKSLCLQLDASEAESPVYKKRQTQSLVSDNQNRSGSASVTGITKIQVTRRSSVSPNVTIEPEVTKDDRHSPVEPTYDPTPDSSSSLPKTQDLVIQDDEVQQDDEDDLPQMEDAVRNPTRQDSPVIQRSNTTVDNKTKEKENKEKDASDDPEPNVEVSDENAKGESHKEENINDNIDNNQSTEEPNVQEVKGKRGARNSKPKVVGSQGQAPKRSSILKVGRRKSSKAADTVESIVNDTIDEGNANKAEPKSTEPPKVKPPRRKKMSVATEMLNSPATVSSPGVIPSPMNSDTVQPLMTRASRKTRAKKTMSDDWLVGNKQGSKIKETNKGNNAPSETATTEVKEISKTKTRVKQIPSVEVDSILPIRQSSLIDFMPRSKKRIQGINVSVPASEIHDTVASPGVSVANISVGASASIASGANVSVTAAEAIKAMGRRNKRKTETVVEAPTSDTTTGEGSKEVTNKQGRKRRERSSSSSGASNSNSSKKLKTDNVKPARSSSRGKKVVEKEELPAVTTQGPSSKRTSLRGKKETEQKEEVSPNNATVSTEETSTKRTRGRPKKVDVTVSDKDKNESTVAKTTRRRTKVAAEPPVKEDEASEVDPSKRVTRRGRPRLSEAPKKDEEQPSQSQGRGRRRKTEPVKPVAEDKAENVKQSSLPKQDLNIVPTQPSLVENVSAANSVKGRKRKAEMTPERVSSSAKSKGSGSGSSTERVRSRGGVDTSSDSCSSPSLRKVETLNRHKWNVMFTGYNEQGDMRVVGELQGQVTQSIHECTVLVTNQIRRTAKFLSMVAKGVPIVSPAWIAESKKHFRFLNPWDFILSDPPNEKKWGFKLADTLQKAKRSPLLQGLSIHVTEHVQPAPDMCRDIITCGGGQYLEQCPVSGPDTVIVSCPEDKESLTASVKAGIPLMDKEWLLTGLLKYKLDKKLKLLS